MKIERIEVFKVDLPFAGGVYRLSGGREYSSFDATFVRVITDEGIDGWGESTPFGSNYVAAHAMGVRAGIAELAPNLLGLDPRRVDRLNDSMDGHLAGHGHAKAPIDVACWDILGKAVDLPVCELLGGRTPFALPLISSVHQGDPDDMRARVAENRARGYMGHSVKIGALESEGGPTLDAERVSASLADRSPGEYFIVDANGGLSVEHALRFLKLLPDDLDFVLEAPCPTWHETVRLGHRVDVPIILDELAESDTTIVQMIAEGIGDGIGLKISKNGGLTSCRRQRDIALAAGFTMSVQDTVGSEIAFSALLHMGQTVPHSRLRCILDVRAMVGVSTASIAADVVDGRISAPVESGLGVIPDLGVLGSPVAEYS